MRSPRGRSLPAPTRKILKYFDVVLASASPRRAELIRKIPWLRATVFPSLAPERRYAGGDPARYAVETARQKAADVLSRTGGTVIGADTVVAADGLVLGKPTDERDAERMFRLLCGRTHEVVTGYCVAREDKIAENAVKTYVTFGDFRPEIVYAYIRTGASMDKAGGYGLQDRLLAPLIQKVEGDRDNVVGLPVAALRKTLEEFF